MRTFKPTPRRSGFTLAEALLALGFSVMFSALVLGLLLNLTRQSVDVDRKATINRAFRATESAITKLVESADYVYVYDTFAAGPDLVPKGPGQSGDYLVLAYYQNPGKLVRGTTRMDTTIARVVGVYRLPSDNTKNGRGPVLLFDSAKDSWGVTFPVDAPLAAILPTEGFAGRGTTLADQVFASARDLASAEGAAARYRLFTNRNGTGVLLMARVRQGTETDFASTGYTLSATSRNL